MGAEPAYSFTLPSLADDTTLECRIFHPDALSQVLTQGDARLKGAVLAHPYAPLGGCYNDYVIVSVAETLRQQGYVVMTFNFRGAGDSKGKTSWTGRPEIEDYVSITGFLIYYLHSLQQAAKSTNGLSTIPSDETDQSLSQAPINLLLGGYSYGSLVLARVPHPSAIITRFQEAIIGTAGAEIILRARTLARQNLQSFQETQSRTRARGRSLIPEDAAASPAKRPKASPVTIGGEETDSSQRRSSRDSRRSLDIVRKTVEVPKRVKAHIRRHSDMDKARSTETPANRLEVQKTSQDGSAPVVEVSYLLISPVIIPFTTMFLPPGPPSLAFTARKGTTEGSAGALFLQHPTLAIFGTKDAFTSSRRFRIWAERQQGLWQGFQWEQIQGAGHFWQEEGVMEQLQKRVMEWSKASKAPLPP